MEWKELNGRYVGVIESLRNATPREILGVSDGASVQEIRAAYKKRIATVHPDRSDAFTKNTDTELAKIINSAYEALLKSVPKE